MLRDIAFFLVIYLVFKLIRNIFNPVKVGSPNMQSQAGASYYRKEEGKVEVKDVPASKPSYHHHSDDGEYIDYKEV